MKYILILSVFLLVGCIEDGTTTPTNGQSKTTERQNPVSVPEPSVLGLLAIPVVFLVINKLKKRGR
jgi:PBP1b-binding outer membrane lipoprotein LpoB